MTKNSPLTPSLPLRYPQNIKRGNRDMRNRVLQFGVDVEEISVLSLKIKRRPSVLLVMIEYLSDRTSYGFSRHPEPVHGICIKGRMPLEPARGR